MESIDNSIVENVDNAENNVENEGMATGVAGAGNSSPEDATGKAYESIIAQQQGSIDALMKQNEALQGQIKTMLRNGIGRTGSDDGDAGDDAASPKDEPGYVPLAELGREFGKRRSDRL